MEAVTTCLGTLMTNLQMCEVSFFKLFWVLEKKPSRNRYVSVLRTSLCKSYKWSLFRDLFYFIKESLGTFKLFLGI